MGRPSPTLKTEVQSIPFSIRNFAVPFVAMILKLSSARSFMTGSALFLSISLIEIKAVPSFGTVYPSDCIAFKNAIPGSLSIPITSPVDFISGPKNTFSSLNFLNGSTAFLTAICLKLFSFRLKSLSFLPTDNCAAIFANGTLLYLLTKGTVLLDLGFTSST